MQKSHFEGLMVSLASPQDILSWSQGVIESPDTVNYRTGKPTLKGLFCESIFGPVKNYECSCGKYKGVRYKGIVCDRCSVEITTSRVRRERMGHIELASPVVHIRYYKATPSRVGLLLDLGVAEIEKILYYVKYIVTAKVDEDKQKELIKIFDTTFREKIKELEEVYKSEMDDAKANKGQAHSGMSIKDIEKAYQENKLSLEKEFSRTKSIIANLKTGSTILESDYRNFFRTYDSIFQFKSGSDAVYEMLSRIDVEKKIAETLERFKNTKGEPRKKIFKLLRLLINLHISNVRPEWMIIKVLPVVPPDLRPIVQLEGGKLATVDANQFYRRVIQRNLRLKKMIQVGMPDVVKKNEIRLLQESVNNLISGEKNPSQKAGAQTRTFKSLTDMLSGKEGIFRKNLLGKRVDYSGRSVITVGPGLKLDECGLPLPMAAKIFTPFIVSKLIERGITHTPKQAEKLIREEDPMALDILAEVVEGRYVLLNRAPTLHRLSIQAFKVKLMPGKTIRIHPLVCSAFNADFDGDQMAVHLPISEDAQLECKNIMSARLNSLKPASGDPVISHTQDMVLGVYYLTKYHNSSVTGIYGSISDVLCAFENKHIMLHDTIVLNAIKDKSGIGLTTTVGKVIFNAILPQEMQFVKNDLIDTTTIVRSKSLKKLLSVIYDVRGSEETVQIADKIKDLGFRFASQSAISNNIFDMIIPVSKKDIIKLGEDKVGKIQKNRYKGFLSDDEKYRLIITNRKRIYDDVQSSIQQEYTEGNDCFALTDSGARGSIGNLTQLSGMKGQVVATSGRVIELPIKSSLIEGFSPLEYFIGCHGSRKSNADKALRTADAGYLTRRLCDSCQEVVIREEDCQTFSSLEITKYEYVDMPDQYKKAVFGRYLGSDLKDSKGNIFAHRNDLVDAVIWNQIESHDVDFISVRSPLCCKIISGVCQKCFGTDLSTRKTVRIGTPVGVIASQSIGEPGTQLAMNVKHQTGIASGEGDITSGLDRVDELFESRKPNRKAVVMPFDGIVSISESGKIVELDMTSESRTKTYFVKEDYKLTVKVGDWIKKGSIYATKGVSKLRTKDDGEVQLITKDSVVLTITTTIKKQLAAGTQVKKNVFTQLKKSNIITKGTILTTGSLDIREYQEIMGTLAAQRYVVDEINKVYVSQGQDVSEKYMEVIVKQMFSKVLIEDTGDSTLIPGSIVKFEEFETINTLLVDQGKYPAKGQRMVLGLTQIAKEGESRLSSASFQETVRVMVDNSLKGSIDPLSDLKANVILGRLLPIGSNFGVKSSHLISELLID